MKHYQTNKKTIRRSGFTLLELLIVLGIILAIAAMVVPNLLGRQQEANIKQTRINIANLEAAAKQYAAANNGAFPPSDQYTALLTQPQTRNGQLVQPYLEVIPKDAWGQPLNYDFGNGKYPGDLKPAIWSNGPNQQNDDGGNDDITNWAQLTGTE